MRDQSSQHYFGLDIGTGTVRCVVGMLEGTDNARLSVIGHGSAPNLGMRKGSIVHLDDVVDSIVRAVTEAERVSGVHIQSATVNVNGAHVSGINSKGVIAISAANREIDDNDRLRVEEAATIVQLPPNREIIQVFAKNYSVDGQDNIKDPVGMHGIRLEVDTHIVTASTPVLRNLDSVLDKARVNPAHRTVSSLASAEAVLNRQQKESGTLLLDIGAGTTNLVVVEDGEVQHVAVIPVGGINITNDLAIGLKTDLDIAEQVKIKYASLQDDRPKGRINIEHDGRKHFFEADDVHLITEARIEELLELVDKELKKIHRSRKLPGGVVFVGGTAKLPGLAAYAKEKLQLASRVGALQPMGGLIDTVQDPAYSTAVGLMMLDMLLLPSEVLASGQPNSNVFGFVDGLFKKFKR
jgi:cell division protein FtsA